MRRTLAKPTKSPIFSQKNRPFFALWWIVFFTELSTRIKSCDCFRHVLLRFAIGWQTHATLTTNQKPDQNWSWLAWAFSRTWRPFHASHSDWLIKLFKFDAIGESNYPRFGFNNNASSALNNPLFWKKWDCNNCHENTTRPRLLLFMLTSCLSEHFPIYMYSKSLLFIDKIT